VKHREVSLSLIVAGDAELEEFAAAIPEGHSS